jgi:hypothetical protein
VGEVFDGGSEIRCGVPSVRDVERLQSRSVAIFSSA